MLGEKIVLLHQSNLSKYLQQAGYEVLVAPPGEAFQFFQKKEADLLVNWEARGNAWELRALGLLDNPAYLAKQLVRLYLQGKTLIASPLLGVQALARLIQDRNIEEEKEAESKEMEESAFLMLAQISKAIEERTSFFAGYGKKLEQIALGLAQATGVSSEGLKLLRRAALVHQLGMIHVPETVISKAGPLSAEERPLIQSHATMVRKILSSFPPLNSVASLLMAHHEWYNGDGYPTGLAEEEISLEAQVLGLAEAYISLTSPRPHRQALPHENAMSILKLASGTQFDPKLVETLPKALSNKVSSDAYYLKLPSHVGLVALGGILHLNEHYTEAQAVWDEANTFLEPKSALKVLSDIWGSQTFWALGHLQGIERAKKAIVQAYKNNQSLLLGHALLNLGLLELSRGRLDECLDLLPLAVDLLEQEGDHHASALATWALTRSEFYFSNNKKDFSGSFHQVLEKFLFYVERLALNDFVIRHDSENLPLLLQALSLGIRRDTVRHLLTRMAERGEEELLRLVRESKGQYSKDVYSFISEIQSKKVARSPVSMPASSISLEEELQDPQSSPPTSSDEKELMIRCFGRFQVTCSGTLIAEGDWKTRKVRSIFAYLLTHPEEPISEETLLELFWPTNGLEKGRHALHTTIYRLRRALEPSLGKGGQSRYVLHKGNAYYFNRHIPYWIDLEEFEKQIKRGQIFENQGETEQAQLEYEKAHALYTGAFIPEHSDEPWCTPFREKYQRLFIRSLLSLIQFAATRHAWKDVIQLAGRVLKEEPSNEQAHQMLMQAYFSTGKRDEAMQQYHVCLDLLKNNLHISPSEETVSLYQQMQKSS